MSVLRTLCILVFFALSIPLAAVYGTQSQNNAKLTSVQVNEIVTNFLNKIGQPVKITVEPSVDIKSGAASSPQSFLADPAAAQMCWRVVFSDSVYTRHVEVSDATGQILHYIREDHSNSHKFLSDPISQEQAVAQATSALMSAGAFKTKELVYKSAEMVQGSADTQEWYIFWSRLRNGIPYRDQGANVSIDAQTGEVIGFSVNFRTLPLANSVFSVNRDKALTIATEALAKAGMQFPEPPTINAEIVQPNGYWKAGNSETEQQSDAHLAWVCHFRQDQRNYEAWVDGLTGDIIGGQYSAPRGRQKSLPNKATPAKK